MRKLQNILDDIAFESLPPAWTTFNLADFSAAKRLWDYQQTALQSALKVLWKYYDDFADYQRGEWSDANAERKRRLFQWYRDNRLDAELDISLRTARRDIIRLLEEYYPVEDGKISYEHFINRMGFWMATGSGKTLVIVKLMELLWRLIRLGEIPPHDMLVLTHRDDLLEQLRAHVAEFNASHGDLYIRLRELREYPEVKRETQSLFRESEATVFFYRSDNLSDEQKEKIVDFRNYDDRGHWYVLLDEAHKGDKEDSKRQQIYSILARNGFLFNFSATFTDDRDVITTACDFNLARFIDAGYGKHISILKQENRAFRDDEDYTGEEKQKVVLKSLLMLAYARKAMDRLNQEGIYHKPLLLALVNSVNTEDADLKLFFRELECIGKGMVDPAVWQQAKDELGQELQAGPALLFEGERFALDEGLFQELTLPDLLASAFNASGSGETEVLVRPSNRQEIAFKLKTADRPFALIRIGDISGWLKDELAGYEVVAGFEDEGFFERLNEDDSDINILMGSRTFYEGWDSNRPNVITYINIGIGTEARKFILQSVGRGVRIQPVTGKRKRLLPLHNAGEVEESLFRQIRDQVLPLETLFILGTNRHALQTVIEHLDQGKGKKGEHEIALTVNQEDVNGHTLLIPVYRLADQPLFEERDPAKFSVAEQEFGLLQDYVSYLGDDRLLLAIHDATPRQVDILHRVLNKPDRYFTTGPDGQRYGSLDVIVPRLFQYFGLVPHELDRLKCLEDEIQHFRHIKVFLEDISELQRRIEETRRYPSRLAELRSRYETRQLAFEEFVAQAQSIHRATSLDSLEIRHIAHHYYAPVILSNDEKADYIRHIIRHASEVRFIRELDGYLESGGNAFQKFDWWLFSKLDETLDSVYLPYYDPDANRIRRFYPDFVFWMQKGADYSIVFVDPKGMQQTGYQHKIDGYQRVFGAADSHKPRSFQHNGLTARVYLRMYTPDANRAPERYRDCWFDHVERILPML